MDNKNQILESAGVLPEQRGNCYVSNKGGVFTPRISEGNTLEATGEQAYAEWIKQPSSSGASTFQTHPHIAH